MAGPKTITSSRVWPSTRLLRKLVDGADLLDVAGPEGERYLLVAVSPRTLEELGVFEAQTEDDEEGADLEPEEVEPNVAAPAKILPMQTWSGDHATVREWRKKSRRLLLNR